MQLPYLADKLSAQFWMLCFLLFVVFALGGSSRIDIQSLAILNPLSIIACGVAAVSLRREHLEGRLWLLCGMAAITTLTVMHIVPLPPELQSTTVARQEVFSKISLGEVTTVWYPFTVTPTNGWATLVSLSVPFAVIGFGVQLSRDDLFRLLLPVVGLGVISGLIGIFQVVGSPEGSLYFYRITDPGSAVGLFANRNHASVFLACLFPALAVIGSTGSFSSKEGSSRPIFAAAIAVVLVPLIIVTGSRSGLLVAIAGLAGGFLIFRPPTGDASLKLSSKTLRHRAVPLLGTGVALCLGIITVYFSRAVAIERFTGAEYSDDGRIEIWIKLQTIFQTYFPIGSGLGSFAETFKIHEPLQMLDETYLNRAHNDWIEIAVTMGVPGLFMLAIGVLIYIWRMFSIFRADGGRRSTIFSRMAGINLALLAVASVTDYPLRTPALMALAALFLLWFSVPPSKSCER